MVRRMSCKSISIYIILVADVRSLLNLLTACQLYDFVVCVECAVVYKMNRFLRDSPFCSSHRAISHMSSWTVEQLNSWTVVISSPTGCVVTHNFPTNKAAHNKNAIDFWYKPFRACRQRANNLSISTKPVRIVIETVYFRLNFGLRAS